MSCHTAHQHQNQHSSHHDIAEIYPRIVTGMVDGMGLTMTMNGGVAVPRHVSLGQDRQETERVNRPN